MTGMARKCARMAHSTCVVGEPIDHSGPGARRSLGR